MGGFVDPSSNLHPYECDGPGSCVHCERRVMLSHDPSTCALCDPEYDGGPPLPYVSVRGRGGEMEDA